MRRLAVVVLACAAGSFGCKREQAEPPAVAEKAAVSASPTASSLVDAGRGAEAVATCRSGLAAALKKVEQSPMEKRLGPALAGIGEGCPVLLGALAAAATEASKAEAAVRSKILSSAATPFLPPTCAARSPSDPALEVSYACPPPDSFELAEPLLEDLDAGTYQFALVLRERLGATGVLDSASDRLLSNLVLAAALEGEAR